MKGRRHTHKGWVGSFANKRDPAGADDLSAIAAA